ncbi:hypothetical protein F4780DRAFT_784545 [Xylariomycetidae sp. FL0641]|nr:hypothetical protein F4780DRAFT_784545 [Xylariomycetidae sp. FL0641]
MPQFVFVELPSFRTKDLAGRSVNLSLRHLGAVEALYQFVRRGLRANNYADLAASLVFSGRERDVWTSAATPGGGAGLHAEENLLLAYYAAFDSPGAFPIVDALLLAAKPCPSCLEYFTLGGKQLRPTRSGGDGNTGTGSGTGTQQLPTQAFRAKFTPRSDRAYTPVFYLARTLDPARRGALWLQLARVVADDFFAADALVASPDAARGQMYYLLHDSPWYALNDQDGMTDTEVAEAIASQQISPTYWVGRRYG